MIVLLDSTTPICRITFIDGENKFEDEWQADRTLAKELLGRLESDLKSQNKTWSDITALGALEGPGSFTGIRIGLTVLNTIANAQSIPIVGARGRDWQAKALEKLNASKDEKIVLPFYGAEANITTPRK